MDALTHSEAALVINALVAKRRGDRKNINETEYVCFLSALAGGLLGERWDYEKGRMGMGETYWVMLRGGGRYWYAAMV